jgi:hypothetical protein
MLFSFAATATSSQHDRAPTAPRVYTAKLLEHRPTPVLSSANARGAGKPPDGCIAFNPSFIPASPTFNQSGVLVRLCYGTGCVGHGEPQKEGAPAAERIGFAPCNLVRGTCGDVLPAFNLDPTRDTEDPRAILYDSSCASQLLDPSKCALGGPERCLLAAVWPAA